MRGRNPKHEINEPPQKVPHTAHLIITIATKKKISNLHQFTWHAIMRNDCGVVMPSSIPRTLRVLVARAEVQWRRPKALIPVENPFHLMS